MRKNSIYKKLSALLIYVLACTLVIFSTVPTISFADTEAKQINNDWNYLESILTTKEYTAPNTGKYRFIVFSGTGLLNSKGNSVSISECSLSKGDTISIKLNTEKIEVSSEGKFDRIIASPKLDTPVGGNIINIPAIEERGKPIHQIINKYEAGGDGREQSGVVYRPTRSKFGVYGYADEKDANYYPGCLIVEYFGQLQLDSKEDTSGALGNIVETPQIKPDVNSDQGRYMEGFTLGGGTNRTLGVTALSAGPFNYYSSETTSNWFTAPTSNWYRFILYSGTSNGAGHSTRYVDIPLVAGQSINLSIGQNFVSANGTSVSTGSGYSTSLASTYLPNSSYNGTFTPERTERKKCAVIPNQTNPRDYVVNNDASAYWSRSSHGYLVVGELINQNWMAENYFHSNMELTRHSGIVDIPYLHDDVQLLKEIALRQKKYGNNVCFTVEELYDRSTHVFEGTKFAIADCTHWHNYYSYPAAPPLYNDGIIGNLFAIDTLGGLGVNMYKNFGVTHVYEDLGGPNQEYEYRKYHFPIEQLPKYLDLAGIRDKDFNDVWKEGIIVKTLQFGTPQQLTPPTTNSYNIYGTAASGDISNYRGTIIVEKGAYYTPYSGPTIAHTYNKGLNTVTLKATGYTGTRSITLINTGEVRNGSYAEFTVKKNGSYSLRGSK